MRFLSLKAFGILFLAAFLAAASGAACGFWQSSEETERAEEDSFAERSSDIPFSTKEPENFQAEIVVTSFAEAGAVEEAYFIARRGKSSLQKFDARQSSRSARAFLRTADDRTFLIDYGSKSFREISAADSKVFSDDALIKNLTSKWLNEKASVTFEKAGTEKNLTKYRAWFAGGENSEVLIYVDENIKLPVRQEFYTRAGEEKILKYKFEIRNFKPAAAENLFKVPDDFRRIEN